MKILTQGPHWFSRHHTKTAWVFLVLLGVLISTFSQGFHHPDEHYSILELMTTKTRDIPLNSPQFNWDVQLFMRSFLQPFLYLQIHSLTSLLTDNPFHFTFVLRCLQYFLGLFAFYQLFKSHYFKLAHFKSVNLLLLTFFTWYVPYILVRPSSEALSAIFFILGLSLFLDKHSVLALLVSGIFLGLSFGARFQMGIACLGLFTWALWERRFSHLLLSGLGLLFILVINFFIDSWAYGEWVFTPWNYFRENILHNRVNSFGTSPFYYYFLKPTIKGLPPLSLLLLLGLIRFFGKFPRHPLTWILIPFIFVHSLIGHKEVRFLFFAYLFLPYIFFLQWPFFKQKSRGAWLFKLAVLINFVALIKVCLGPAYSPITIYRAIYNKVKKEHLLLTPRPPSRPPLQLPMRFYLRNHHKLHVVAPKEIFTNHSPYVVSSKYDEFVFFKSKSCQLLKSVYPEWILQYNTFSWRDRSSLWALWRCP